MKGKVVKAVLIILILILGIVQIVPEQVEATGTPKISTILDEAEIEIDVRPGSDCTGVITGRVISDEPVRDVRVMLQASTDQGWPCKVDPVEMIVPPRSEAIFSVEITAMPECSYYTSCVLTVGGTAGYNPGTLAYAINPVTGVISVRQYSKFSITCSKPYITTQPGGKEIFEVNILNEGNARETYNIEITNVDDLDDEGFTVTISHSEIEVQEKDNGTVRVKVSAPSSISGLGSNDLEIQITPKNLDVDDAQAETYTLVIKVCEDDILLTTEFQIIIVIIIAAVIASVFFIRWRRRKNKLKYLNN